MLVLTTEENVDTCAAACFLKKNPEHWDPQRCRTGCVVSAESALHSASEHFESSRALCSQTIFIFLLKIPISRTCSLTKIAWTPSALCSHDFFFAAFPRSHPNRRLTLFNIMNRSRTFRVDRSVPKIHPRLGQLLFWNSRNNCCE